MCKSNRNAAASPPADFDRAPVNQRLLSIIAVSVVGIAGLGAATWKGVQKWWTVTEGHYPCGFDAYNTNPPLWTAPTTEQWLGLQTTFYAPFVGLIATLIASRLAFAMRVNPAYKALTAIAVAAFYTWMCVELISRSLDDWIWMDGNSCNGLSVSYVLIGAPACMFVVLSMVGVTLRIVGRVMKGEADADAGEKTGLVSKAPEAKDPSRLLSARRTHWLPVLFCVLYIPLLVVITAFIPNSFSNFGAWSGARDPAITGDGPSKGVYNIYLFSRTSAATGTENRFYLKFYSTVMMYYGFLYLATLVGLASALSPAVYSFLHRRASLLNGRLTCSYGEAGLGAMLTIVFFYFFGFWLNHGYESQFPTEMENKHTSVIWARMFGQLAALFMGLLVLPLPRAFGFWSTGLGVSWEAGITFHRWAGWAVFFFSALHQVCWWVEWSSDVTYETDVVTPNGTKYHGLGTFYNASWKEYFTLERNYHTDDYTITCITAAWWTAVVLIFCLAMEKIRRNYFEVFYYAHHFGMVFLFICMLHGHSLWYYTFGGLSLWLVDRIIRFNKGALPAKVVHVAPFRSSNGWEDVTRLVVEVPDCFTYTAGQYAFVNIPEISALEWHPFTISSSPLDGNRITFHIKAMGKEQWTGKLNQLIRAGGQAAPTVFIDGAYGTPPDFDKYEHVVFVAGGIGITPARSMMMSAAQVPQDYAATLLWVVESFVDRTYMDEALDTIASSPHKVAHKIVLRGNDVTDQQYPETIIPVVERSDVVVRLTEQLKQIGATVSAPEKVLVHVCGPPGLRDAVMANTYALGFHFHTETFAL